MAVISYEEHIQDNTGQTKGYRWSSVTESDTCEPVRIVGKDDVTISVHGTLGGATLTLNISSEGSGVNEWTSGDVSLSTANTAALVSENGVYYKPVFAGGTSQSAKVVLIAK